MNRHPQPKPAATDTSTAAAAAWLANPDQTADQESTSLAELAEQLSTEPSWRCPMWDDKTHHCKADDGDL